MYHTAKQNILKSRASSRYLLLVNKNQVLNKTGLTGMITKIGSSPALGGGIGGGGVLAPKAFRPEELHQQIQQDGIT